MIGILKTYKIEKPFFYSGQELRPHYLLTVHGVEGTSLAAFRGPCHVRTDDLVDYEDSLKNDFIKAKEMVHFLGEFFGMQIFESVLLQRLLISICNETIHELKPGIITTRKGDDLYWDGKKLSVSIVTMSTVSALLHAAVNIDASGAPLPATGLNDLQIDPDHFTSRVLEKFNEEILSAQLACTKVRPLT